MNTLTVDFLILIILNREYCLVSTPSSYEVVAHTNMITKRERYRHFMVSSEILSSGKLFYRSKYSRLKLYTGSERDIGTNYYRNWYLKRGNGYWDLGSMPVDIYFTHTLPFNKHWNL